MSRFDIGNDTLVWSFCLHSLILEANIENVYKCESQSEKNCQQRYYNDHVQGDLGKSNPQNHIYASCLPMPHEALSWWHKRIPGVHGFYGRAHQPTLYLLLA